MIDELKQLEHIRTLVDELTESLKVSSEEELEIEGVEEKEERKYGQGAFVVERYNREKDLWENVEFVDLGIGDLFTVWDAEGEPVFDEDRYEGEVFYVPQGLLKEWAVGLIVFECVREPAFDEDFIIDVVCWNCE